LMIRQAAHAKINLFLEARGGRTDGFHELETVMTAISLADDLTFEDAPATSLETSFEHPEDYAGFPVDERNIVLRAARLLETRLPAPRGARVRLFKRIPMGGGLAGGSADAAAALHGLNALWGLGLTRDELLDYALRLGSDVPFCSAGGAALCRGRGEIMSPIRSASPLRLLLVSPGLHVSTADVFRALDQITKPDEVRRQSGPTCEALAAGDTEAVRRGLFNRLEETALRLHPALAAFRGTLLAAGLPAPCMTGSGACFFSVLLPDDDAETLRQRVVRGGQRIRAWVVETVASC
jgi:4-diphosphocytidyl-2-C-methyl-D-erythritol kinase